MIRKYFRKKTENQNKEVNQELKEHITNLRKKLDFCLKRFKSVQILNSNSNYEDSYLLQTYLFVDIMNIMLFFENKNKMGYDISLEILRFSYSDLENEDLRAMISFHFFARILELETITEKKVLAFERELKKILKQLKAFVQKEEEKLLIRKKYYLSIFLSLIFIISLSVFLFYRFNPPPLVPDTFEVFYKESRIDEYTEKKSFKKQIKLHRKWQTYNFIFPEEVSLSTIKFYPIKQRDIRLQLKNIKIIAGDGKTLKNIDFKIKNPKEDISFSIFSSGSGLKVVPKEKGYIELVTLDYNPYFEIESELIFVKKIILNARFSEQNISFKE